MYRLELGVNNRTTCYHPALVVALIVGLVTNEPVKVCHESRYLQRRWGYEPRVLDLQSPDEVLNAAKLARLRACISLHEISMHFTNQCGVERMLAMLLQLRHTECICAEIV